MDNGYITVIQVIITSSPLRKLATTQWFHKMKGVFCIKILDIFRTTSALSGVQRKLKKKTIEVKQYISDS